MLAAGGDLRRQGVGARRQVDRERRAYARCLPIGPVVRIPASECADLLDERGARSASTPAR